MVSPAASRPPSPPKRPATPPPSPAPAPAAPGLAIAGPSSAASPRPVPRSGLLPLQLSVPARAAPAATAHAWRDKLPSLRDLLIGSDGPDADQQRVQNIERELTVADAGISANPLRNLVRRGMWMFKPGESVTSEMVRRRWALSGRPLLDSNRYDCATEIKRLLQAILNHTPAQHRSAVKLEFLKAFGNQHFVLAFADFAADWPEGQRLERHAENALCAHGRLMTVLEAAWELPAPAPSDADLKSGDPACRLGLFTTVEMRRKKTEAQARAQLERELIERKNLASELAPRFNALPDFLEQPPTPAASDGRSDLYANKVADDATLMAALEECNTLHVLSRALATGDVPKETKDQIRALMYPHTMHRQFLSREQALAMKQEIAHRLFGTPNPDRPAHKDRFLDGTAGSRRQPEMLINDITEWMQTWKDPAPEPAPASPQHSPRASGARPSLIQRRPGSFPHPRHS
jgi:hypothetical protein